MKLGITLPSFVTDPGPAVAVARAAEASGVDGVFAFDHLFRVGADGQRRPALECVALLGAVSAATRRIALGPLVARATLRPPAVLAAALDTMARLAPDRLVAAIGAGDSESRAENETFGLGFATAAERVHRLHETVATVRDRGYPVWVGGNARAVRAVAATGADGWNEWGGTADRFQVRADELRRVARRQPFECTWGGLVSLDENDARARRKAGRLRSDPEVIVGSPERVADRLAAYRAAGADWIIVGPVDSANPQNATWLGEAVAPRLRDATRPAAPTAPDD